jgi:aminomethyltransferase
MKHTPLHAAHLSMNAKMGEFAGYDMPLYYDLGVLKEHEWTRAHCGIFDVSHMGQITLAGSGALAFLETLAPSSFSNLAIGSAKYSVLMNGDGGITDDFIVTRCGDQSYFCVLNAGCKDWDIAWIKHNLPSNVTLKTHPDYALVAVQGPETERVMREAIDVDVTALKYMQMMDYGRCYISRLGYTGEDGFELSVPVDDVDILWSRLLAHPSVKPIGLAARDSLRLEMGYCLYGHDIDATTTPLEADLGWVMRRDGAKTYIGADKITTPARKRVGITLTGKGVAREGTTVHDTDGTQIGVLSSGGYGPTLKQSIGQAYLPLDFAGIGTEVQVNVRGNMISAEIAKMPFMQPKTKTGK